ncbi:hypothetical protein ACJJI5_07380 [Microbulbifer sp. EKSA008]|uniref:hypothetical protein n=1 Tax=unclassified Microbulbifer TaxID=2619833 RepID=UPI0040390408
MKKWIIFMAWATLASIALGIAFLGGSYAYTHFQEFISLYKHATESSPGMKREFPFFLLEYLAYILISAWCVYISSLIAKLAHTRAIESVTKKT